jgi:hypothetical protein
MSESISGSLRRWFSRFAVIAAVSIVLAPPAFGQVIQTNVHGFGDRQNSYAWSMAWFNGKLYVGTARNQVCVEHAILFFYFPELVPLLTPYSDPAVPCPLDYNNLDGSEGALTWSLQAEIWQYTPGIADPLLAWKRVFQSPADLDNPQVPGKKVARDIGFRDMVEFKEPNGKTALYVAGVSAKEFHPGLPLPRILRSEDGEHWAPIPQDPGTVMGTLLFSDLPAVTFRSMKVFDKRLFVTASQGLTGDGYILESSDPSKGNNAFKLASNPSIVDTMHVFEMEVFNGQLYAGTGSLDTGYAVYRTTAKAKGSNPYVWEKVLGDGAGRGKTITSVVSMHPFKGRLYVGSSGWNQTELPASELIRISPTNQWDVVVGKPRTYGTELKSPISGIPDSFGNLFNFHFWRMQEDHGVLSLTTNDGSLGFNSPLLDPYIHDEYGFDMYATNDGVFWTRLTRNGFDSPTDFGGRTMASTKVGLFIGTANHQLGTAVLLGNFPRPMPSQLIRLTSEIQNGVTILSFDRVLAPGTTLTTTTTTPLGGTVRVLRAEYIQTPAEQPPIQTAPGVFLELPHDLVLGPFVEIGQTDQSFFVDDSALPGVPYAYSVEPVENAGQPVFGSNFVFSLIPPATLTQLSNMVSAMTKKGTIKNVDGYTPLSTLIKSMTTSLKSGKVAEARDTADLFHQEVALNPGIITDLLDATDLELLSDKFLRRINMSLEGLIPAKTLP